MKTIPTFLTALNTTEKFALSGEMLLRGLGTVFMVLIILYLVLKIFGAVFGEKEKTAKVPVSQVKSSAVQKKASPKAAPKTEAAASPVPAAANTADDAALIAVITAAIAAYQSASGQPNLPFRVVSFTRKNNASGWMGNSADNQ